jgi:hypothetical protein
MADNNFFDSIKNTRSYRAGADRFKDIGDGVKNIADGAKAFKDSLFNNDSDFKDTRAGRFAQNRAEGIKNGVNRGDNFVGGILENKKLGNALLITGIFLAVRSVYKTVKQKLLGTKQEKHNAGAQEALSELQQENARLEQQVAELYQVGNNHRENGSFIGDYKARQNNAGLSTARTH